ncbi:MAG TPA: DUF3048 domain-containing protein [Nitrolancea sp.]|nr:DUF3048 domain-containing protein [Nitrolancea sp.]
MKSLLIIVLLAIVLSGCSLSPASTQTDPSPATPSPSPTPTPTPSPSPTPVIYRSPLTGEQVPEPPPRPVAVQVDNAPAAWPHIGLTDADIVYETPTEAQLTRFTAFYQTRQPDVVGPARSARLVDLQIVPAHDAMLAFSGASSGVQERLWASGIDQLFLEENASEASWRDPNRYAPHNLFSSIPALREVADRLGWSRPAESQSFDFGPVPEGGSPSSGATIPYSAGNVEFTYNPTTMTYDRFMAGLPHADAATGKQVSPRNLVVMFATFTQTDIVEDSLGELSLDVHLQGSGDAWVFRDGKRFETRWERNAGSDTFHFIDVASGQAVPLAEGQSWICLGTTAMGAAAKP